MLSRVWVCECYWGDCISPHCHRQPTQSCHYPVTLIVLVFQVNEKAPRPNFSAFLPSIASPLCSATHIHSRMHFISARPSSDRFNLIWIFNGESYGARRCCICVCADSKIMTTRHGDSECAALFLKDVCIFNATRTAKKREKIMHGYVFEIGFRRKEWQKKSVGDGKVKWVRQTGV